MKSQQLKECVSKKVNRRGPKALNLKRERIIEAAKNIMHDLGIVWMTLADIARESNIPAGNMYYYYKTKEEIVLQALEARKKELLYNFDEDAYMRVVVDGRRHGGKIAEKVKEIQEALGK